MITRVYHKIDEEQLRKIDNACFPVADCVGEKDFASRLHQSEVWLDREAWRLDVINGFAFVDPGFDSASLIRLAVREERRGQSIGGKLVHAVLDYYRPKDYRSVRLHVRLDNVPAQKLYLDYGFQFYEIAYKYYADEANAAMMRYNYGS
jgi:ribosomal protein S18 acetylase RimI-like enzyme